jgi:hypothetical protein
MSKAFQAGAFAARMVWARRRDETSAMIRLGRVAHWFFGAIGWLAVIAGFAIYLITLQQNWAWVDDGTTYYQPQVAWQAVFLGIAVGLAFLAVGRGLRYIFANE